jgi:hypothetical protein
VGAGISYLVGERGPEVFTPGSSGAIRPINGGQTVRVVVEPIVTPDSVTWKQAQRHELSRSR